MSLKVKAHFVQAQVRTVEYRVYYYPLAQLRWRRGYSIWFVRPSVCPSVRLSRTKCVHFSSKGIKLWTLKPLLIYSLHIGVVHLVFTGFVAILQFLEHHWISQASLTFWNLLNHTLLAQLTMSARAFPITLCPSRRSVCPSDIVCLLTITYNSPISSYSCYIRIAVQIS